MSFITRKTQPVTALAAISLLALSACGNGDDEAAASEDEEVTQSGDFGELTIPLSWLHTAEFAGLYMAGDNGYYEDAGFDSVNLVPGGPTATPSPVQVATGQGTVGMSNPLVVGSTIDEEGDDAPLKIIGSVFQDVPYTIISHGDDPVEEPEDLVGKSVGVAPANEPVFYAMLEANGIDEDDVDVVSIQGDAQDFLAGEYDAYHGFATNELISMELDGEDVASMMFVDAGLPFAGGSIVATEDAIENDREELKAFLEASIRGWHDALADHEAVAETTVENHAADQNLDFEHQQVTSERQAELIDDEWTAENGLFTMSDELIDDTLTAIEAVGYEVPDDLFDLSLLEEIYEENPDLVEHP
ncbi:ABC transporter substrate-binding protein [Nesterenkonia populi]|uniref:ABC transporter substrate-binding protein n=1 Tax=Nesterenkonia populi TaxID=1591087 RepID=UPI0011BE8EE4|nr:ABC transporter substrate-binding protein [Nesterenkonia populi]